MKQPAVDTFWIAYCMVMPAVLFVWFLWAFRH